MSSTQALSRLLLQDFTGAFSSFLISSCSSCLPPHAPRLRQHIPPVIRLLHIPQGVSEFSPGWCLSLLSSSLFSGSRLKSNQDSIWRSAQVSTRAEGLLAEKTHKERHVEKADLGETYEHVAKDVLGEGSSTEAGKSLRRETKEEGLGLSLREKMRRCKHRQPFPHIEDKQRPIEK